MPQIVNIFVNNVEIRGRKSLVLGAGRSGVASARFLAERGASVVLHDKRETKTWSAGALALKADLNVGMMSGDLPSWLLDQIDLVIISPGVPSSTIPARYVDRKDGEVIGEVELAYRFLKGRIVGITGSNGKTTTTTLIGEILKEAGSHTNVGGNIGTPLIDLVDTSTDDGWTVAELSSFQLETIVDLRCDVALCLNVTPNHLDRYGSFLDYAAAKHRIFANQRPGDTAILNADNEITRSWTTGLLANVVQFSTQQELKDGLFLRGNELISSTNGETEILTTRNEIFLRGTHNVENVLAAFAAGRACGVSNQTIRASVAAFRGVEHRIEFVDEINGVRFYNDSKATSVDATSKALEALLGPAGKTVLILGGRGKNAPYSPLIPLIRQSVRSIVVIGEDAENIRTQLSGTTAIENADSLPSAVEKCFALASPGDSVLLAPACASFDMFLSFEERGSVFKAAVSGLRRGEAAGK